MATMLTQAALELRVGAGTVAQYCCDDGSQVANTSIVDTILREAEDIGTGLLGPGFTEAQVLLLYANDYGVRGAFLDIAADLMGRRRPALVDQDGKTPFSGWRAKAEKVLERASQGDVRLKGEAVAGTNANVSTGVTVNRAPADYVFAATAERPKGRGGF